MVGGGSAASAPEDRLVGTDTLGRPFTDAEKRNFDRVLTKYGFAREYAKALAYAHKKTGGSGQSFDVMSRVVDRLVRQGWDPAEVSLGQCLFRFVYCEWTHEMDEREVRKGPEEKFGEELRGERPEHVQTAQEKAVRAEEAAEEQAQSEADFQALWETFHKKGDAVNLEYLGYRRRGIESPEEMARESQRDVREFYRAADRRKRAVRRLIAEKKGITVEEDPS